MICEDEGVAYLEPVLVEKRAIPPVIPDQVKPGLTTGTVFLQDVYAGDGLKGIPRGTVKKLRVGTYDFSPWRQGGLLGTNGRVKSVVSVIAMKFSRCLTVIVWVAIAVKTIAVLI